MNKILFSQLPKEVKAEYNKKMVAVLAYFVDFCERYHLRYSLAYGSVLGAVRHKGIIPWDYDIDTYMPRPDYERFIELFKKEAPADYHLLTPNDTPYYPEPFAKIGDENTTLLFTKLFPVNYGVFIDVFVLDGAAVEEVERKCNFANFNKYIRLFRVFQSSRNAKELLTLFCQGGYKHVLLAIIGAPFKKWIKGYCLKQMRKISYRNPYEKSEYAIQYRDDSYGCQKSWLPKKWIEETIIVPFESINVRIPKEYDSYLKHYYGDYMQLPPEDKRDDRHEIDYLNIHQRESLKDVIAKLNDL